MTVGESNSLTDAADPAPPTAKGSAARSRATAWIISAGVFVVNLDLFIVNVAVPALGDSFHGSSLASLSWVLNAYAIVFAALLVVAGFYWPTGTGTGAASSSGWRSSPSPPHSVPSPRASAGWSPPAPCRPPEPPH